MIVEKLEYFTEVIDGLLSSSVSARIRKELHNFNGRFVHITIKIFRNQRTLKQNALYHVYVTILQNFLGYEHDEMHKIVAYKFLLTEKVDENTGEIMPYVRSTTDLDTKEFTDFIEQFRRWSAIAFGLNMPDPPAKGEEKEWIKKHS